MAERRLLGTLMLTMRRERAAALVAPEHFSRDEHRAIFEAICVIELRGGVTDAISVGEEMELAGTLEAAGGFEYLAEIIETTPTAVDVATIARNAAMALAERGPIH